MCETTQVLLEQAWRWICPRCEEENWARSQVFTPVPGKDDDLMREMMELEPHEEVPWEEMQAEELCWKPDEVMCKKCASSWMTIDPAEILDEDEDGEEVA